MEKVVEFLSELLDTLASKPISVFSCHYLLKCVGLAVKSLHGKHQKIFGRHKGMGILWKLFFHRSSPMNWSLQGCATSKRKERWERYSSSVCILNCSMVHLFWHLNSSFPQGQSVHISSNDAQMLHGYGLAVKLLAGVHWQFPWTPRCAVENSWAISSTPTSTGPAACLSYFCSNNI